jgi:hypothetical protein
MDIVIGMDRRLRTDHTAQELDRMVGADLVGIHVGLTARAGLKRDERKFVIPPAVDDLLRGFYDHLHLVVRQLSKLAVRQRCAFLHDAERTDYGRRQRKRSTPIRKHAGEPDGS